MTNSGLLCESIAWPICVGRRAGAVEGGGRRHVGGSGGGVVVAWTGKVGGRWTGCNGLRRWLVTLGVLRVIENGYRVWSRIFAAERSECREVVEGRQMWRLSGHRLSSGGLTGLTLLLLLPHPTALSQHTASE